MSFEIHNWQLPIIVFLMSTKYIRPKKAKAAQVNHNLISWLLNYVECFNFSIHNMYFWKKNQEHVKVKAERNTCKRFINEKNLVKPILSNYTTSVQGKQSSVYQK